MKTTVAVIVFETSKVVTLIAENSGVQRCDITGIGIAPYDGYVLEGWNNPAMVNDAIISSIRDAEEQSHTKVTSVRIGIPGAFSRVYPIEVTIPLKGTDPKVTPKDLKAIYAKAKETLGDPIGVIIHTSPAWFTIDGNKRTFQPINQSGRELSALISYVVADRFFVDEVRMRLEQLNYRVEGVFSNAAGEMMLYLPENERDYNSVLIDCGYLSTDVMVAQGDALTYLKTIPMGGGNISADLAEALNIRMEDAENRIKRVYRFNIETKDETYDIPAAPGQPARSFTREEVSKVILQDVDILAEEIAQALQESGVRLGPQSTVYMTGGGLAFNRGALNYLSSKLGRPVREISKKAAKLNSHTYSSVLGVMDLIIGTIEMERIQTTNPFVRFFHRLMGD